MNESRVRFLETTLAMKGFSNTLRAMDWMIEEMNSSKGFSRHNGTHYYYHLVDATQDLISLNLDLIEEDYATACILHDAIEDIQGVTPRMIENMFGSRVATIVDLVTKKKGVDYKLESNIASYLHDISLNRAAALVKTADRKHNFGTLRDATPEKQMKQAIETETYFIPFFKTCRQMYPRYAHYFFAAKTAIEPHLWSIKEHYLAVKMLNEIIERQEIRLGDYKEICARH